VSNSTVNIFIVVQLGLENLSLCEFKDKSKEFNISYESVKIDTGGIEVIGIKKEDAYFLNEILKTPTRIILRLHSFKVRDLPKLYNKLIKINWNEYFVGVSPKIKYKAVESRLFDSRKVEKAFVDAINFYQDANAVKKKILEDHQHDSPTLYIRNIENQMTISIDTTGERLDKRGNKLQSTTAPIRATIASAALQALKEEGIDINRVIDPLAGSGTILIETKNFSSLLGREFSFQNFVNYKGEKRESFKNPKEMSLISIEVDDHSFRALEDNTKLIKEIECIKEDFFNFERDIKDYVLITNPPYNERLKTQKDFLKRFMEKSTKLSPKAILCIHPSKIKSPSKEYREGHIGPINNGGINVYFSLLEKIN
jgi:putative N6-adenine-specific DNA methylase